MVDVNYSIQTPARVTRLLKAPESLVFLFRKDIELDILEYINMDNFSDQNLAAELRVPPPQGSPRP